MTVKFYFNSSPPSRSVNMMIKHLGKEKDFEFIETDAYFKGETRTPEFLKMNPQHCLPTIDDGGFYLWESRAILKYLDNKYQAGLVPKDAKKAAIVDRLLYFDLNLSETVRRWPQLFKIPVDDEKKKKIKDAMTYFDGFLDGHQYVAGDQLTIADISLTCQIGSLLALSRTAGNEWNLSETKNVANWYERMKKELPFKVIEEGDEKLRQFVTNESAMKQFTEVMKQAYKK